MSKHSASHRAPAPESPARRVVSRVFVGVAAALTLVTVGAGVAFASPEVPPSQTITFTGGDGAVRTAVVSRDDSRTSLGNVKSAVLGLLGGSSSAVTGTVKNSPGDAQAIAAAMLPSYGWNGAQFTCLVSLWNKESHWRVTAQNGSGAYGIPQALPGSKMAAYGSDWATSATTQITWGLHYIKNRWGTPCGAWTNSQSQGWY